MRAWVAWADPQQIANWFVDRAEGEARPGDTMKWFFDTFGYGMDIADRRSRARQDVRDGGGDAPGRTAFPYLMEITHHEGRRRARSCNLVELAASPKIRRRTRTSRAWCRAGKARWRSMKALARAAIRAPHADARARRATGVLHGGAAASALRDGRRPGATVDASLTWPPAARCSATAAPEILLAVRMVVTA